MREREREILTCVMRNDQAVREALKRPGITLSDFFLLSWQLASYKVALISCVIKFYLKFFFYSKTPCHVFGLSLLYLAYPKHTRKKKLLIRYAMWRIPYISDTSMEGVLKNRCFLVVHTYLLAEVSA